MNKVQEIFKKLRTSQKREVIKEVADYYDLSLENVRNNWLVGSKLPDEKYDYVLSVVKENLQKQIQNDQKLLQEV